MASDAALDIFNAALAGDIDAIKAQIDQRDAKTNGGYSPLGLALSVRGT